MWQIKGIYIHKDQEHWYCVNFGLFCEGLMPLISRFLPWGSIMQLSCLIAFLIREAFDQILVITCTYHHTTFSSQSH